MYVEGQFLYQNVAFQAKLLVLRVAQASICSAAALSVKHAGIGGLLTTICSFNPLLSTRKLFIYICNHSFIPLCSFSTRPLSRFMVSPTTFLLSFTKTAYPNTGPQF